MIIPVRCFTCGKVIADRWEWFVEQKKIKSQSKQEKNDDSLAFYDRIYGELLDELGLVKLCCRRHMLGHIDLIEVI